MVFSYCYVNTNPSWSSRLSCQSFSTSVSLFKWIRSFSPSARSILSFSQRCSFQLPQVAFVFPALPPFLFKDSDILIMYPFIDGKSLHSFPSMFLSGDSHEDSNGASSSSFLIPFSSPVDSSQVLLIIPFSSFQCLLIPVHLIIIPLLAIYCSEVLKISRRFVFPLCIRSSSFEIGISFKSFNSTGATSLLNLFNGVLLSGP